MSDTTLLEYLDGRPLLYGSHDEHTPGEWDALEAESQRRGLEWTDDPTVLGLPDMRKINDGPWSSDEARTEHMAPMIDALRGWGEWPEERRQRWTEYVAIQTVRRIVSSLPDLPDKVAARCRNAETLEDAALAAKAGLAVTVAWAATEAERSAAEAARAALEAAWAVEDAALAAKHDPDAAQAARANPEVALIEACRIWTEAVEVSAYDTRD